MFLKGVSCFEANVQEKKMKLFLSDIEKFFFTSPDTEPREKERQSSKKYSYFGIMCVYMCVSVYACMCVSMGIFGENLNMKHSFELLDVCWNQERWILGSSKHQKKLYNLLQKKTLL